MKFPLMSNNIDRRDINHLIKYLKTKNPRLTQGKNVEQFEKNWSKWLGVKYSVFVNSGSSANLISLAYLKYLFGTGEIIVPTLTWVSDIASIIQNGFKPIFVDISLKNLSMNSSEISKKISKKTKAIFITHALGFNALNKELLKILKEKKILLIEDVCESHGAKYNKKKLGSYGFLSNFSFYFAHHISTIEGGMISTNNYSAYQYIRMFRSHGLLRESNDSKFRNNILKKNKLLNPEFIFTFPAYNVRNTELGAVIGLSQLKKINYNIKKRNENFLYFLKNLDKKIFMTNFDLNGISNYGLILILNPDYKSKVNKLMNLMNKNSIEFRRGTAGGGNQLRQPYLKNKYKKNYFKKFKNTEYVHFYGFYLGNYPDLTKKNIKKICNIVNGI